MMCLVDYYLEGLGGHFFEYARALYEAAQGQGIPFCIWARQALQKHADNLPSIPVFRNDCYRRWSPPWPLNRLIAAVPYLDIFVQTLHINLILYQDMIAAARVQCQSDCTWFFPTVGHNEMLAIGAFVLRIRPRRPVFLLMRGAYRPFGRWTQISRLVRWELRFLELLRRKYDLRIITDSERLAQEYRTLTSLPVDVVAIPHTTSTAISPVGASSKYPHFVMLGDARREKGFVELVDALHILAPDLCARKCRFTIYTMPGPAEGNEVRNAVLRLRTLAQTCEGITLIDDWLSSDGYQALLCSSDCVIIPYRKFGYYARTSGAGVEALAAGKPIITTADTWLADQMARYGDGLVFQDGDATSLAAAIQAFPTRQVPDRATLESRREAWLALHNPEALLRTLMT